MRLVIEGSEQACQEFQEARGSQRLMDLLDSDREYAFDLLHTLVINNPSAEIGSIIGLLSSAGSKSQGIMLQQLFCSLFSILIYSS